MAQKSELRKVLEKAAKPAPRVYDATTRGNLERTKPTKKVAPVVSRELFKGDNPKSGKLRKAGLGKGTPKQDTDLGIYSPGGGKVEEDEFESRYTPPTHPATGDMYRMPEEQVFPNRQFTKKIKGRKKTFRFNGSGLT